MKILLDTCAFIWLSAAPKNLGSRVAREIDEGAELFLSDGSVWEICLKWQTGKIQLPDPPRMWVEQQCHVWKLQALAIKRSHMYRVIELPQHHRDPFDRLLVAQAIENGMAIATPDPEVARYPVSVIW